MLCCLGWGRVRRVTNVWKTRSDLVQFDLLVCMNATLQYVRVQHGATLLSKATMVILSTLRFDLDQQGIEPQEPLAESSSIQSRQHDHSKEVIGVVPWLSFAQNVIFGFIHITLSIKSLRVSSVLSFLGGFRPFTELGIF